MNLKKLNYIHFIGIGGIGMSAIARYFNHHGLKVSGYDKTATPLTQTLQDEGITVYHEDQPAYLEDLPDTIIYTPAVPDDHPEFNEARANGIPLMKRSTALGKISEDYQTIAVAGTHGKTTTSTMIASLMKNLGVDLTAFLGGLSNDFDGNLALGNSPWMITEADEYDRSFLKLHPQFVVINSLDPDHLDIYGEHDEMVSSYADFVNGMPTDSKVIVKYGLEKELLNKKNHLFDDKHIKTFGFEEEADYRIDNANESKGSMSIKWSHDSKQYASTLGMAGDHNAMNGLAAMAACVEAGFEIEKVATALSEFKGIHRRFEKIIDTDELVIIDDYAHHPKEIEETVRGVRRMYPGRRIIGVFQAHLYTRTRDFLQEFAKALAELDVFYSCELYPAREKPIPGISGKTLFDAVQVKAKTFMAKEELGRKIEWKKNDVILIMGAGNINSIISELKNRIE